MFNSFIKILLGPVFLAQGKWARKNTLVLPEPPGERKGVCGAGPRLNLLIVGDSAAAGVGADHQDDGLLGQTIQPLAAHFTVHYRLWARSTITTRGCEKSLLKLAEQPYDVVLTSLGVNDITSVLPLPTWIKQQARIRSTLREKFDAPLLIITSLPPMGEFTALPQPLRWFLGRIAREFNLALKHEIAKEKNAVLLEFNLLENKNVQLAADNFHPGPSVYKIWGAAAAELIIKHQHDQAKPVANKKQP